MRDTAPPRMPASRPGSKKSIQFWGQVGGIEATAFLVQCESDGGLESLIADSDVLCAVVTLKDRIGPITDNRLARSFERPVTIWTG